MTTTEEISGYIDDFVSNEIAESGKNEKEIVAEEKLSVEESEETEATPCSMEDIIPTVSASHYLYDEEFKTAVERQISESDKIGAMNYEVDGNKIMIQDLKSSVVSLKVSTSRIERDVKELSDTITTISTEKRSLDNSLIDLEFRFNELVTHEEYDKIHTGTSEEKNVDLQKHVKTVVEKLEDQIQQMDERINIIDQQNSRVQTLSEEISRHEKMVNEMKRMLSIQEKELNKITELKEPTSTIKEATGCDPKCASQSIALRNTINDFITKTELNERSIATAWVGLVGALLLIPIAWIMGRFF